VPRRPERRILAAVVETMKLVKSAENNWSNSRFSSVVSQYPLSSNDTVSAVLLSSASTRLTSWRLGVLRSLDGGESGCGDDTTTQTDGQSDDRLAIFFEVPTDPTLGPAPDYFLVPVAHTPSYSHHPSCMQCRQLLTNFATTLTQTVDPTTVILFLSFLSFLKLL
jgi:hypothetical protein